MNTVKATLIAVALASTHAQWAGAGEQQASKGLIEDSTLNLLNRNFWMHRDYRNARRNTRNEWDQGIQAHYVSGFTPGTLGLGFDVHAYGGIKLDGGRGSVGNGILPVDSEGRIEDSTGELGGAVKLRVSSTTLKYGEQRTTAPVFATSDSRLLPETATGVHLASQEYEKLSMEGGHFTSINRRDSSNADGALTTEYAGVEARSVDFIGATYHVTDRLSLAAYASQAEELWRQYFANVYYTLPLAETQTVSFDLVAYKTRDQGAALAGQLDNTAYSLKAAYSQGPHKLSVAYQKISGDDFFDYIGGDSIWLANSVQYSDFNAPNERSWQLRYDLNLVAFGVPGLTLMARYVKGDQIDGTRVDPNGPFAGWAGDDQKHWERDMEARYVIQAGMAKDLSFRLRQATHRSTSFDNDLDEVRLIVEYPLSLL
ncbi:OprD family porin [Pseudomonas putida]|uniref:OprD family porin n=1 Tax=Pseudomonas putida TaxID=303 RepID=UPI0018D7B28E|nr:OprD family porin [Pseudomonas putida]MBH3411372.1 OprD family porin [Pseudomonas putida]